jgi:hypothetical protein
MTTVKIRPGTKPRIEYDQGNDMMARQIYSENSSAAVFCQLHVLYLIALSASSSICLPTEKLLSLLSSARVSDFSRPPSSGSGAFFSWLLLLLLRASPPLEPKRPIAILHSGCTSYMECTRFDDGKHFPVALTTGFCLCRPDGWVYCWGWEKKERRRRDCQGTNTPVEQDRRSG